jgi:hypothetical protein
VGQSQSRRLCDARRSKHPRHLSFFSQPTLDVCGFAPLGEWRADLWAMCQTRAKPPLLTCRRGRVPLISSRLPNQQPPGRHSAPCSQRACRASGPPGKAWHRGVDGQAHQKDDNSWAHLGFRQPFCPVAGPLSVSRLICSFLLLFIVVRYTYRSAICCTAGLESCPDHTKTRGRTGSRKSHIANRSQQAGRVRRGSPSICNSTR